MCESAEEAYAFTKLAAAAYINIGTLTREQEEAMLLSARAAKEVGIPVVLDPVGCAAIPRRKPFIDRLRTEGVVSVVKGNRGEINSLAGVAAQVRGVDALDDGQDGTETCMRLARDWNCIVVATGKVDIITDGKRVAYVQNGHEVMTRITGAGCMLGALLTAFCGAHPKELFEACTMGTLLMGVAGDQAAAKENGHLPGTFRAGLMDAIYSTDDEALRALGRLELRDV
ncbi:hydroxyethylthiazole kinase [Nitritalea halalkaliphila LW7]|uniref:hydroxyethylthiazole kinase n=1 Tax=Nitritalea halalkaliphila LW7 TaxID=1189621 RepID=I5BTX7_9BACT|nr:hydroxyethylthiazole kinase [Nitritalea halalkaliphila LW7]